MLFDLNKKNKNMSEQYLFTSESVSEGHPDKVCDIISDSVVDDFLSQENPENSRVAMETLVTTNKVVMAGEVRGPDNYKCDYESLARDAVREIGYEQDGFHWNKFSFDCSGVHSQSADIAMGVDASGNKDQGAGDQGIMFGYACKETPSLMPAPIYYSHKILEEMAIKRKKGDTPGIQPDSKSQVTLQYKNGSPEKCTKIVVSTQHDENLDQQGVSEIIIPIIKNIMPEEWISNETEILINPTGKFVIGGPDGDTGLTGRKIIVDTYGGAAPHGGGAFSGKDPTKVDRSAAYISRYIAKNVVASKIADKCLIQLAYAIGVSKPLSIYVDLFDNDLDKNKFVVEKINENFDLSPRGIREMLNLNRPIYEKTAAYGHFGRTPGDDGSFSWEKTDKINVFSK